MARRLNLDPAPPGWVRDAALLVARLAIGGFLIHGVWDNIVSAARMAEFARFLAGHGFPLPHLMAPLSVGVQFVAGAALVLGIATRWAGLLVVANFVVALAMVDAALGVRGAWPSVSLVVLGLIFASFGAGRIALDPLMGRHRR
ncbi:DoxX family protein [Sphingomonas sp.]|uniref:DoxX family protein n=1 Tax=Sphingomonas sp. TaxID=28214 RepID=UPI002DD69F5A|nr:DoxX family protein [Sphingomonas sp.]